MRLEKTITLYDYTLPIISNERRYLIPKYILLELLNSKNIDSLRANLASFYPKLTELTSPINLESMHSIFRENYLNTLSKLIKNSPNNARSFLMNFLIEYEIEDLNTILRSRLINKDFSEVKKRIHWQVEEYTKNKELFIDIIRQKEFQNIFNLLKKTIYEKFAKKSEKLYHEIKSPLYLNTFLVHGQIDSMKQSLRKLNQSDREIALKYFNLMIDYFNYMVLFRGKSFNFERKEISDFLILEISPGKLKILDSLLPFTDLTNLLNFIRNNNLKQKSSFLNFPDSVNSYSEILNHITKNFYINCLKCVKKINESQSGLSTLLAFILLKKFQLKDLIQISTGIEYGLPKNAILERTILIP